MKPSRADLILAGSVCLLAVLIGLCLWLFVPKGNVAVVCVDGAEVLCLDLAEDTEITVNHTHKVVVRNGEVWVESAPCRDQVCVKHPPVSREGETVVCLPYAVTVTVESDRTPLEFLGGEVTP